MMPSLRLDQSELKCKNGCDYFGNPQWQGYCSKCHRELMQRQRRAEKTSTSTLPKPEQKKSERNLKSTSHSSFSKFEEKRLKQSETLKKANLLKFNVFKKSSQDDHHQEQSTLERRQPEFKIPSNIFEGMKREFRIRFPTLSVQVDRDARKFVQVLILDVMKCSNLAMSVDELSERVQRQYQHFMTHMYSSPHFSAIDSDTKELLMDFVEKHAMTYLHELPSVVFSPTGTDDERLDRTMSERIQQLSWVTEKHLECKLDKDDHNCRQLLYKAISELLGMDSAMSPGGKLSRVRRCCRHVLALCAPPASADDLLPALIFTVLKANPPRLLSNINFVSRFSNAQRLMTGEAGYYFTNLCCAVSFIEKLTADSLNMDKKEFDCYMAMPASIGGSSWAAALSLCAELREVEEERALTQKLLEQAHDIYRRADELAHNATTFEETISKKVQDVLSKTPLEIKPRRELPRFGKFKNIKTASLIDLELTPIPKEETQPQEEANLEFTEAFLNIKEKKIAEDNQLVEPAKDTVDSSSRIQDTKLNILGFEVVEKPTPPKTPPNFDQAWDLKQTSSLELLTPSPSGFTPFDVRSVDELMTPDEFAPGLGNINYDIDLSDLSGENSMADDAPKNEAKDPFSPEGLKKEPIFDPFAPPRDPFSPILEPTVSKSVPPVPYTSIMPQLNEPFSPLDLRKPEVSKRDPFSPVKKESTSILDDNNSPTTACLLPSPLKPQTSNKDKK